MSATASPLPTVLSVDDSQVVQKLIQRALVAEYRVLLCGSSVQALSLMNQEPVEVLLLDVSMPEIDGLDFCRTVRSIPQFQALPIVMLTARGSSFDKVQGRLAGATEYLTKPFDAEQLRQIIRSLIKTK
ncbi:response regulator [Kovacikia minuta CCNUW1]|uniref:response regulator n=1 Tax=Kovacikia minuta TaxID=2931930 RepID=UPI001CCFAA98|nr:response regulator [Kovacikia minuta]UBF25821.1 response regulator [Kovacikia minuta CCNUW1]